MGYKIIIKDITMKLEEYGNGNTGRLWGGGLQSAASENDLLAARVQRL